MLRIAKAEEIQAGDKIEYAGSSVRVDEVAVGETVVGLMVTYSAPNSESVPRRLDVGAEVLILQSMEEIKSF